jgi:hypothetical protein
MEQEEMRRQREKVEGKMKRLEQQLADENSRPSATDASVGLQVSNGENGTRSAAATPAMAASSAPTEGVLGSQ